MFGVCVNTELQSVKEGEKRVTIMKMSFEKQLQSERTLKIQVSSVSHLKHMTLSCVCM